MSNPASCFNKSTVTVIPVELLPCEREFRVSCYFSKLSSDLMSTIISVVKILLLFY